MLPTVLVDLIHQFCDIPQQKLDLNRLVKHAYREWIFSKGKPELHCHYDVWTRSYFSPVEYYVDDAEWKHMLGMFRLYDNNYRLEREDLKRITPVHRK